MELFMEHTERVKLMRVPKFCPVAWFSTLQIWLLLALTSLLTVL